MEIQNRLLEQLQAKLPPNVSLGKFLMDELELSRDSAYRRVRGETVLKPEEIQHLCEKFDISIDKIIGISGKSVTFQYNPIMRSEFSFEGYLNGIMDAFKRMAGERTKDLYMSNLDLIIFQLLNSPTLLRFKLMYFGKCYLKIPTLQEEKYFIGWTGGISNETIQTLLNHYIRINSIEVIGYEAGKGLIREIVSFYELGYFKDQEDALFLIDEVVNLISHMHDQADIGRKFIKGQPVITEEGNFSMYLHQTYIQDNTFISDTSSYRMLYITHNMMNYLYTIDPDYVNKSFAIFKEMVKSCIKISEDNPRQRKMYFDNLVQFTSKAKLRIEGNEFF